MRRVPAPGVPFDLIDLKFLPAWVKEDWSVARHARFEGEEEQAHWPREGTDRRPRPPRHRRDGEKNRRRRDRGERDDRKPLERKDRKRSRDFFPAPRQASTPPPLPQLDVHFLPQAAAFENVAAQIKTGAAAYSVYALARLFLQKPERYHVRIKTKDATPLFRLGESNAISTNRFALENSAFRLLREKFYTTNVTLHDPIKGDFSSVARERTTGTLLGPTNHHGYQPQLRRLYEQRFSRRMIFADFQRQIEIVSDPALVEQWKEEARKVTTFTTRQEEPPQNMMPELAGRFRRAGLQIFRHRKGMLFVSPIRLKTIDETVVSDSVRHILETLKASPRINRKEFAEKFIGPDTEVTEAEKTKLALASDLHWMIREGHVIEFNDGSLDLPRAKPPKKEADEAAAEAPPPTMAATAETPAAAVELDALSEGNVVAAAVAGGSADNSSIIPGRDDTASPARTEGASEA